MKYFKNIIITEEIDNMLLFEKVKNKHFNKDGESYEKETEEKASDFQELINSLLKLDNIVIEVIGSFLWVTGETTPYKEKLKLLGLRWHSEKKCWYLSPKGYRRFGGKNYSMDEIRGMYGVQFSEEVKGKEIKRIRA